MNLRCFLFSTDEATAEQIRQAAAEIQIDAELCAEGFVAIEQVSQQPFPLVIVDWNDQPEAGSLLTTARQRKANERPLTLAIVGDDASVPKALQAGANSILRKPVVPNHVKDTLVTARDLLRARQNPAKPAPPAATAVPVPGEGEWGERPVLRAGEFLQSAPIQPGGQFETEDVLENFNEPAAEPVDALKDLEPVASTVDSAETEPQTPAASETRGLEWYLKARGAGRPNAAAEPSGASGVPVPVPEKTELLGYEQTPSYTTSIPNRATTEPADRMTGASAPQSYAELASNSEATVGKWTSPTHDETESAAEEETSRSKPRHARQRPGASRWILIAAILLAIAAVAVPQAPWHSRVVLLFARGQRGLQAWLNPQPVITASQAPIVHEDFARPGDEYKLPPADPIPDATTDPSQIRVVPEVDPTAKKAATDGNGAVSVEENTASTASPLQPAVVENHPAAAAGSDTAIAAANPSHDNGVTGNAPAVSAAPQPTVVQGNSVQTATQPLIEHSAAVNRVPTTLGKATATSQKLSYVSAPKVPSSLQSQMASVTPDPGGNKPVDAAMPSFEPVAVTESVERALLADQPPVAYPPNAKSQQGNVTLQVLIGRDGSVQDAKFLQGSFVFAKAAIDGVRQWRFKPYILNGRPVSVQTNITVAFKPGS